VAMFSAVLSVFHLINLKKFTLKTKKSGEFKSLV